MLSSGSSATTSETVVDTGHIGQIAFRLVLAALRHQLLIQGPGRTRAVGHPGHMLCLSCKGSWQSEYVPSTMGCEDS